MSSHVRLVVLFMTTCSGLYLASELYPYPDTYHGSPRSLRQIRECHDTQGRDEIYEVAQQNSNGYPLEVKSFTDDIAGSYPKRFAYGHVTVVSNPRDTFSVYEPGDEGSCVSNTRQRHVTDTASAHNCFYASNAGFFNTQSGQCLGNMWSDGRLAVNGKGIMNPNFGILKNGTIITGYLTEDHVTSLEWINLVQGIIWLVRDGKSYVEESISMECQDMQTTGSMDQFVSVVSARTAVGHDIHGNVRLVHVEGKTWARGINLREFATLLVSHGLVNAINLDGGSSSTVVYNDTIISYPSSHCPDPDQSYRCQRAVSSVLCVHGACNCVHGTCTNNTCACNPGYTGEQCDTEVDRSGCLNSCTEHGTCTSDGCLCEAGWVGSACNVQCPDGYYGNQCTNTCQCAHGTCNFVSGACTCDSGWQGAACDVRCSNSTWGINCNLTCDICSNHGSCDPSTGECLCSEGWQGKICAVYRGTARFLNGVSSRELAMLGVVIVLLAVSLISVSINVNYCLKTSNKQNKNIRGSSSSRGRSPRLPAADITTREHTQRQIPVYREIQRLSNNQQASNTIPLVEKKPSPASIRRQSHNVLEMIEKLEVEEESDADVTSLLLK